MTDVTLDDGAHWKRDAGGRERPLRADLRRHSTMIPSGPRSGIAVILGLASSAGYKLFLTMLADTMMPVAFTIHAPTEPWL